MSWRTHYNNIDEATTSYAVQSPFSWTVLKHKLKLCNKYDVIKYKWKVMQSKIVPYNLNFTKRRNGQFIFDKKKMKKHTIKWIKYLNVWLVLLKCTCTCLCIDKTIEEHEHACHEIIAIF